VRQEHLERLAGGPHDLPGNSGLDHLRAVDGVIEVTPGLTETSGPRAAMSLRQFLDALDSQRRSVFAYLDGLGEADLQRKARIPLFKQIMDTDEISIPVFVGAFFDYHWPDHAGQLAKIRKAAGLPEAR
jgi:hypothetical protein